MAYLFSYQQMKVILFLVLLCPLSVHANEIKLPSQSDIYWLTQNIYHEARNQSLLGQLMIGMVTLERLNDGRWGDSIKSVVTARKQFSWYSDGKSDIPQNKKVYKEIKKVALLSIMLYSSSEIDGVMFYHNDSVNPYWTKSMVKYTTIGNHIFYKEK
jgi:spore germination cell wall hydrolase CwlJ-like protein